MEARASYVAVGAFVLVVLAGILGAAYLAIDAALASDALSDTVARSARAENDARQETTPRRVRR